MARLGADAAARAVADSFDHRGTRTMTTAETTSRREIARREARARRGLARQGMALKKDRARTWSVDRQGGYMIVDPNSNALLAGEKFDLSLETVESWAKED